MPLPQPQTGSDELVVVSSYTRFDNLAHGPRGTEAKNAMYSFRLDPHDGQLLLLSVDQEPAMNPAFSRYNPYTNMLHACTESVAENGQVITWEVDHVTGRLSRRGSYDAEGTSTCYITIDRDRRNLLVVNYWDATLKVIRLNEMGIPSETVFSYDPKEGRQMQAKADGHVNHSRNDAEAQRERQADPHSHAIVLDPLFGRLAFVPDLGKDVIRQFRYSPDSGSLQPIGAFPSGVMGRTGVALGPRYIDFHPTLPIAVLANEGSASATPTVIL
jgi:6-phosphogluconolactonase (cycloisomerase 2 family)